MKSIQKTFSYRLKPTSPQKTLFAQFAGSARFVFNQGLAQIKKAFEEKVKIPTFTDIANQLPLLKKSPETGWLKNTHSQVLQQSLKDLESALKHFFRRVRAKQKPGFPRFKCKGIKDSFRYPQGIKCVNGKIYLPKIGWVTYYDSQSIKGTIKQAVIKRRGEHWYIHIVCLIEKDIKPKELSFDKAIGIDLGLEHFAYFSNGQIVENPRFGKNGLKKLAWYQKKHSHKKKGSNNRKKSVIRLTRIHERIANQRKDFLHKLSTQIVENQDIVIVENLSIKGMIQNRKLSRSIADAGWRALLQMLKYKTEWCGKRYIEIDRFAPTSKLCSSCNNTQDMPLAIRRYMCKKCGLNLDRDFNAAINIRAAGLAVLNACGGISIGLPSEAGISGL